MSYKLVFIDDNMKENLDNPFVRSIGKFNKDAELVVFIDPSQGLQYVLENLNNRMIVFVDCKFDGYSLQGIQVLKEIRKTTSLLYIVMMSANSLSHIEGIDIISMINEDYISFFDRNNGTIKDACVLIDRIKTLWNVRLDCVLEDWLMRHPEDAEKIAFKETGGKVYLWKDILCEIRQQTEVGRSMEKMVIDFFIHNTTKRNS